MRIVRCCKQAWTSKMPQDMSSHKMPSSSDASSELLGILWHFRVLLRMHRTAVVLIIRRRGMDRQDAKITVHQVARQVFGDGFKDRYLSSRAEVEWARGRRMLTQQMCSMHSNPCSGHICCVGISLPRAHCSVLRPLLQRFFGTDGMLLFAFVEKIRRVYKATLPDNGCSPSCRSRLYDLRDAVQAN